MKLPRDSKTTPPPTIDRAELVAWLRERRERHTDKWRRCAPGPERDELEARASECTDLANMIERGEV